MYYLESSQFLWGVVVPEWRWQLNEPQPPELDAPDGPRTPLAPVAGGGAAAGALLSPALPALPALPVLPGAAAPAALQKFAGPEAPAHAAQPGAAPPPPDDSETGHWVLVGTTTRWYSTLQYNPMAAMTRQLAVQEDADADRRRGERDREVTDRHRPL